MGNAFSYPNGVIRSVRCLSIKIVFIVCLLLENLPGTAQSTADSLVTDIGRLQFVQPIGNSTFYRSTDKNSIPDKDIPNILFTDTIPASLSHSLPFDIVGKDIYIKFRLSNSTDSSRQVYFFPGLYCQKMEIFKAMAGSFMLLPVKTDYGPFMGGTELIELGPHQEAVFYGRLEFVLTTVNTLNPRLVAPDFITYFKSNLVSKKITVNLLNYLTAGILLMMIFYSFAVYIQNHSVEFVYYSVYAGCMALLLFLKSYLFGATTPFNYFFEGYLDFMIQITGYFFYILFFRKFLNTREHHPFLEKILSISSWIILSALALFSIVYLFGGKFVIMNLIEIMTKQVLLLLSIVFVIYGFRKNEPLLNYLITGQFLLTLFSIISFVLIVFQIQLSKTPYSILNDSLLYYQIGLVLELFFFMSGLSYKNKRDLTERIKERERLKLENERNQFDRQMAVLQAQQEERTRISADMHDELGSGVTAIRLMSEIVKSKMKENTLPEIEKISQSANELLNKMNTIIWTMVSSNDSVESLVAYIRAYAVEFFETTPISCHFNVDAHMANHELTGEKRRNIFLAVKEALNNVLKHSQASNVTINIIVNKTLVIDILDDGIGINLDKLRIFGNGLHNMQRRIASIDGTLNIYNNKGTNTVFELKLE